MLLLPINPPTLPFNSSFQLQIKIVVNIGWRIEHGNRTKKVLFVDLLKGIFTSCNSIIDARTIPAGIAQALKVCFLNSLALIN
jgi:hypothetical protein